MLAKLKAWMQQGTSILGASGALSVLTAWAIGQMNEKQALVALVGCAVAIILPQNTAAKVDAQAVASALIDRALAGPLKPGGSPSAIGTTDPTKTPPGTPQAVEATHL
jgi:hypothetical protein